MRKIGLMLIVLFGLIGCGSGGSDGASDGIESISNSTLKTGETSLGYYGENVKFGNHTVARKWTFTKEGQPTFIFVFSIGDSGYHLEQGDVNSFDFGISDDAKKATVILLGNTVKLVLNSVIDADCYNVTLTNIGSSDSVTAITCASD